MATRSYTVSAAVLEHLNRVRPDWHGEGNPNFNKLGEKNPGWKGGKQKNNGYTRIYLSKGKTIPEHRSIAGKALGRPLGKNEVVHHINGIRNDNRNSNLLICDRYYHNWLEKRMGDLFKAEHFNGRN